MEENNTSDFTLYILLSVSGLLVIIDGLELIHMIYNWQYGFLIIKPIFENCIKYELISKTIFSIYSFISAFSALSLTLFLLSSQEFFLGKFLKSYLFINYIFFGPMMAALSLLGIYHWEESVYVCDKNNLNNKELSVSNSVTIIGCFLLSLLITIVVEFFESFNFLLDSILKRETGSQIIGKFFWVISLSRTNQARMNSNDGHSISTIIPNNFNSNINNDMILNVNPNSNGNIRSNTGNESNDSEIIVIENNNLENSHHDNTENERLNKANSEGFIYNNSTNSEKIFFCDVIDQSKKLDIINETDNINILEKNKTNNPNELSKNT